MKKIILTITILILASAHLSAQSCLPEGIEFTTQAQIDSFQINYPECTIIGGDVFIGPHPGSIDITNLDGLSALTGIDGSLNIGDCCSWPSGNPYLTSIQGLSNLTYIGNDLNISKNDTLRSLDGLQQLSTIGGALFIESNPLLTSLTGLEGLSEVADVLIWFNDSVVNLTGLDNLTRIDGSLMIEGNEILEELTGLESLYAVGGDCIIGCINGGQAGHYNPSLISLSGLKNLTSVGGQLFINSNIKLTSFSGLENLVSIGRLRIELNQVLEDISALENVVSAIGGLEIMANPKLTSLSGIRNINAAANASIYIGIHDNASLLHCDAVSVCEYLSIGTADINIYNNAPGCNSQEEVQDSCEAHAGIADIGSIVDDIIIYPNPSSGAVHLRYSILDPRSSVLEIYSLQGIKVRTLLHEVQPPGEYELTFDISDLPAGMYFVRMQIGEQVDIVKLILIK